MQLETLNSIKSSRVIAASCVCMKPKFRGPSRSSRYLIPDDDGQDVPRNVSFIQTPNAADSPRRLGRI